MQNEAHTSCISNYAKKITLKTGHVMKKIVTQNLYQVACKLGGRTGLMVRASDSGLGDPGSILGRVGVFVSLSKRHLLPKSTGNTQE